MITLYTDRLIIRESSGRDFSRIHVMMLSAGMRCQRKGPYPDAGRTDPETDQSFSKGDEFVSVFGTVSDNEDEELEKFLAYIHTVYSVFGFGLSTVELRQTGEVIGWCGLQPIGDDDTPLGRIELGYLIGQEYRSLGYGYEACRAILDFAFDRLELDEVYARIDERNTPSMALARKLGFSKKQKDLWTVNRNGLHTKMHSTP